MSDLDLLEAWARHLRGRRRTARTITSYRSDLKRLFEHCADVDPLLIDSVMIDSFLDASASAGLASATIERRRQSVRQFYQFLVKRRLVAASPAEVVIARHLEHVDLADNRRAASLLGSCRSACARALDERSSFVAHRDTAIVMLLLTLGLRTTELVELRTDDVDLERETIRVVGSHGRPREVALLHFVVEVLTSYAVLRDRHPDQGRHEQLFFGSRGPLTTSGVRQMLKRRCSEAGVTTLTPSAFRLAFAEAELRRGVPIERLVIEGGWESGRTLRTLQRAAEARVAASTVS